MMNKHRANEHICKYISWYLSDECQTPKFAVLIKGGWGSGKTYFIKQYIKENGDFDNSFADSKTKSFLYLSLYGLSTMSEIDDQIFQQLHPVLSSKGVAIAGKIAKGLLNFGLKIDLDDKGTTEATAKPTLPDISIKSFLNKFSNKYLVFDDLERCNIPIEQVLGYINAFVEHQDTKVIILANDDEIEQELKIDEKKNDSKYHKIKEKVIGKTFIIEADNNEVICSLIERCSQKARGFLNKKHQLCLEIFNLIEIKTGQRNFRAFSHSLRDIEYLWSTINPVFSDHNDLMTYFSNIYLRFNYELQLSNITDEDILKIENWRHKNTMSKVRTHSSTDADKNSVESNLDKFFTRHSPIDPYTMLLIPYDLWYKLLCHSGNINDELNEAFGKTQFFIDSKTPDWRKLWHHMSRDDKEVQELLNSVSTKITSHEYVEPGVILHIFGLFLSLQKLGYTLLSNIGNTSNTILKTGKSYVDWLDKSGKLPLDTKIFTSIDLKSGCYGLRFPENDNDKFLKLKDYLEEKTINSNRAKLISSNNELLDLMYQNPAEFYMKIGNVNFGSGPYWDVAIFAFMDPNNFLESFFKVANNNKGYIFDAINSRYKWLNNSDSDIKLRMQELIKELPFWKKLKTLITRKLKNLEISPSKIWSQRFKEETIEFSIKELIEFAVSINTLNGKSEIVKASSKRKENNSLMNTKPKTQKNNAAAKHKKT